MLSKSSTQQTLQAAAGASASRTDRDGLSTRHTRMSEWALMLVRATWIVVTVAAVGLFIAALPSRWQYLHTFCTSALCSRAQLTAQEVHALPSIGLTLDGYATYFMVLPALFGTVFVAVATLLIWHRSAERIALFGAFSLVLLGVIVLPDSSVPFHLTREHPAWQAPLDGLTVLAICCALLFLYSFPDGRFVPRWTGVLVVAWAAVLVPTGLFPNAPVGVDHLPLAVRDLLQLGVLAPIPFVQVYRYRRTADAVQRQQTKWVVFGLASAVLIFLGLVASGVLLSPAERNNSILSTITVQSMFYLIMLPIPLSIGVAVLRYRLWDIDLIINRTLVYVGLTLSIVGLYVLIVGVVGTVLQAHGNLLISLVATGVVALLFQPLRERLQRGINRLMYGERDEPYAVLSRLGQRLEATVAPEAALSSIVETIAQALKLPYAAIGVQEGGALVTAAAYGSPVPSPLRLPLTYQREAVGELILGPRGRGEEFTPADRRLLDDVARQVEVAVHAAQVTAALQRSRERLVTAREEERRRLRRDLHDGLGPGLASMLLQAETAHDLVHANPAESESLLAGLIEQLSTATADIRLLVYNLRPPALDDLGLPGAIRAQVRQYERSSLQIQLDLPDDLRPLPAAVEVAAFRITQEALTNVIRHANAHRCTVRLHIGNVLELEVTDDGKGLPAHIQAGVGLTSMRERAAELGGSCGVETGPAGGVRVCARLPLTAACSAGEDRGA